LSGSPHQVWSQHLVVLEPSSFLSVVWCGEAFYRLGVQHFRVLFLLFFFFCQVLLQQESILFGLLKVSQAFFELVASGPVVWQPGRPAGGGLVGLWNGGLEGLRTIQRAVNSLMGWQVVV
jgi:hypothetical protein